ncbi:hypothetical protein [Leifsonia sp. AG29]|uniref:hypothetical protein n=1 Tax=Leifsonia sp. AG29 TaxID=2598860 RepID=UPI00131D6989|nr:hypothetical protein [Leifsonia sp. AG29]
MTDGTWDDLDNDVIMALGRLAWAAINVEDRARAVAEQILKSIGSKKNLGRLIDDAVALLKHDGRPQALHCVDWLERAKSAARQRNAVLHSIPGNLVESGRPVLVHIPNSGGLPQNTPLEASYLNGLAEEFAAIHHGWIEAFDPIAYERAMDHASPANANSRGASGRTDQAS